MEEGPITEFQKQHNLSDYMRWALRYFWIILITFFGGFILGQYKYSLTPPQYKSNAVIEILRVKKEVADVDEEEKIDMGAFYEMQSTAAKLKLPHLYEGVASTPLFADRENIIPEQLTLPWKKKHKSSSAELTQSQLGNMMASWVGVKWQKQTTLLDIYATHSDPEIARDVLVGLLAEYEKSIDSKLAGSSNYAMDYILKSSTEVKDKMLVSERTIRLYNRCTELTQEIRSAEKLVTEMEKRYLPKWPALIEGKKLIALLREQFHDALTQVVKLSEEEKKFWENSKPILGELDEEALINAQIQLVLTRSSLMARELEADQQMFDNLLTKLKEGNISKGYASKPFGIVQPPSLPLAPFAPNKKRIVTTYTLAGAALGIGIIFILGFIDPTIRTVSELENLTSLPVIGAMPGAKNESERSTNILVFNNEKNQPAAAEAIRTLRAGLTFLGESSQRKTFLITSALPGEGKSWVAANLALSFALQGDKTLLLDADLRRPVQGEVFGYDKKATGFSDYISLNTCLEQSLQKSTYSENLFILPAGSHSANPAELLSANNLSEKIESISEQFTRIVIDSAPLVPVSDTLPLAKAAQSVVLVYHIGKTPRGAIKRALKTLASNRTQPVGIVANGLPKTRTKGSYGYYYSYKGGGGYSGYYHQDD